MNECTLCAVREQLDELCKTRTAERIAAGLCWIDGGLVNNTDDPTTIRIDAPISQDHRSKLMSLLLEIEQANIEGQ
jgi:hypothetical protein